MAAVVPIAVSPRARAAAVTALRARLRGLGTGAAPGAAVPLGVPAVDRFLPGGLARRGVHEVTAASEGDLGAATGFLLALLRRLAPRMPVLWARAADPAAGVPYAPGLAAAGVAPGRLLLLVARRPVEALWAAEEALRAGRVAVVAELDAIDLTAGRRLQLAAEAGGGPALVLCRRAERRTASAARSRWRVAAAPGEGTAADGVGRSRWRVALVRCRGGGEGEWLVEWDDATDHLAVAAELADRPLAAASRRAG
ncbi:MAG: damage-inducible mutagenesis protein [Alphaproteobacteria bacterium]|nr:damage-inducible mutagenesis protein [Alphaproteobacteria bacterium]